MTPARIAIIAVVGIILVLVGLNFYYRYVQGPFWDEQKIAEAKAIDTGKLQEATDASKYVWDEPIWIVMGKDAEDEEAVVWLLPTEPLVYKQKNGVTEDSIKEAFRQEKPDASIEHVKLGFIHGEAVWEIFYTRKESGSFFYDFYRFGDGSLLTTYNLPKA